MLHFYRQEVLLEPYGNFLEVEQPWKNCWVGYNYQSCMSKVHLVINVILFLIKFCGYFVESTMKQAASAKQWLVKMSELNENSKKTLLHETILASMLMHT